MFEKGCIRINAGKMSTKMFSFWILQGSKKSDLLSSSWFLSLFCYIQSLSYTLESEENYVWDQREMVLYIEPSKPLRSKWFDNWVPWHHIYEPGAAKRCLWWNQWGKSEWQRCRSGCSKDPRPPGWRQRRCVLGSSPPDVVPRGLTS